MPRLIEYLLGMGLDVRKHVFGGSRTTQAQTNQHILAVWSALCYSLFIPGPHFSVGVLCYTFRCLSVRPSVRPCSPFPIDNLSIDLLFLYYMEYNLTDMFHIKGNILWLRTVTLTLPVCELSALDWIKKCFLTVVPLLCGIFKWNFTDMFYIKGYILWQRTITLTFPVHELSALDWSEKWFLTCSSFTIWNFWMKLHRYVDHQRLHIVTKDRHSYLSRLWVIHPWLIWELVFGL